MRQLCVLNPLFMRNYVISNFFVFVFKILQFLLKVIYLFRGTTLQKGLYYFLKVIFINKHRINFLCKQVSNFIIWSIYGSAQTRAPKIIHYFLSLALIFVYIRSYSLSFYHIFIIIYFWIIYIDIICSQLNSVLIV